MDPGNPPDISSMHEDFEDFFENSLTGYITANPQGEIIRCNNRLCTWLGFSESEIKGKRVSDLLAIGGKIYYETHLWPLLRMQGFFDEVALELYTKAGERLEVLMNAYERRSPDGTVLFTRFSVFKATDRRQYEKNLRDAKTNAEKSLMNALELAALREQFIAVLGHDLRNPLGSIVSGSDFLARTTLTEQQLALVNILKRSASRMDEMIKNVMDFARARMGGGIVLDRQMTSMEPVIMHVIDELRTIWPNKVIKTEINLTEPVFCDGPRMAQMFSNLLANAIIHGSKETPVTVIAFQNGMFELSVINNGTPITAKDIDRLFHPFTREETRPSQNGLGLGLYIASEISRSHGGELTVESNEEHTQFTFRMENKKARN